MLRLPFVLVKLFIFINLKVYHCVISSKSSCRCISMQRTCVFVCLSNFGNSNELFKKFVVKIICTLHGLMECEIYVLENNERCGGAGGVNTVVSERTFLVNVTRRFAYETNTVQNAVWTVSKGVVDL